jgi:hypothetical protein
VLDFDTERRAVLLGPEKSAADVARVAGRDVLHLLHIKQSECFMVL